MFKFDSSEGTIRACDNYFVYFCTIIEIMVNNCFLSK